MSAAPSPGPPARSVASSRPPTAARSSSTRLRRCLLRCRRSCCAPCRTARSAAWATPGRSASTSGWSARRTATSKRWWNVGSSARTSTTGCKCSSFACRPCANDERTSCRSRGSCWPRRSGPARAFSPAAEKVLLSHDWPGNVRELGNAVKHGAALARGGVVEPEHLPEGLGSSTRGRKAAPEMRALAEVEREHVLRVLEGCRGNQVEAARVLQISRSTLWRMLRSGRA